MTAKFGAPPADPAGSQPGFNLTQVGGVSIGALPGGAGSAPAVQLVDNNNVQAQSLSLDVFNGIIRCFPFVGSIPYLVDNGGTLQSFRAFFDAWSRSVSAANTSQQVVVELRNLNQLLAIVSAASGGTATLQIEVSTDNANWISIDTLAAALNQAKNYTGATVGATVAVSPVAFHWVRITAGAAGVGFTTTLTVSAK